MLTDAERLELAERIVRDLPPAEFHSLVKSTLGRDPARLTDSAKYPDVVTAVAAAADREDWMDKFLAVLTTTRAQVSGYAGHLAYQYLGPTGLQTMLSGPMFDVDVLLDGMGVVRRHVCLIEINHNYAGTGLLVGPDLVLTAQHVVGPLIEDGRAIGQSHTCMELIFDFGRTITEDGRSRRNAEQRVMPAVDWLVSSSPPHPSEAARLGLPDTDGDAVSKLDYALVRLSEPIGQPPRQCTQLRSVPHPLTEFQPISILQHPAGQRLKASFGLITRIPPHGARLRYTASTTNVSSGSPCWDRDFILIAMHNFGGYQTPKGLENQGVPIDRIVAHIRGTPSGAILFSSGGSAPSPPAAAPAGGVAPPPTTVAATATATGTSTASAIGVLGPVTGTTRLIWSLGAEYPILNRSALQAAIAALATDDGSQLLLVNGAPGSGRSFSVRVIQQFLRMRGHLGVEIAAANLLDKTAAEVLEEVRGQLSLAPSQPRLGADLTTRPARLTRFLLADFFSDLKAKFASAGNGTSRTQQVWLLVDALDQFRLSEETHEVIVETVRRLPEAPLLRLVLIGYRRALPPDLDAGAEKEEIAEVLEADVESYLRYACVKHGVAMPDADLNGLARRLMSNAGAPKGKGLHRLAVAVQDIAKKLAQR